jgi:hypothetical protein
MARAIWSGVLTFGLVSVPVELYSATEAHGPGFHQFEKGTADRISYQRVNERATGEVGYSDGHLRESPSPPSGSRWLLRGGCSRQLDREGGLSGDWSDRPACRNVPPVSGVVISSAGHVRSGQSSATQAGDA